MNTFNLAMAAAVALVGFTAIADRAEAQVGVGIGIGAAPICPYGYYGEAPYACAPYGYYGPEWFAGGLFIGAGPWFHGPENFHGHVDNRFDVHHGYDGPLPRYGDRVEPSRSLDHIDNFRANEMRDGHGHVGGGGGGHVGGGGHGGGGGH